MPEPGAILVVDDEASVRRSTARLLQRAGHEVREAGSAAEALDLLRDGTAVEVIVSDVVMPEMTGIELVGAARALRPEVEVILCSAFTPAALTRHEFEAGREHTILQKPLELAQLLDAVSAALERARR
jgi:DNA-binding NtrC family response regulator